VSLKFESSSFLSYWRWWSLPALLSLLLAIIFQDPFAGDWDSLDYTVLAIEGKPSSMLLGRILFIYTNHLLWLLFNNLFNLQAEQAYLLFKYFVITLTPFAVLACWALCREITSDKRIATLSSLLLLLSPFFVVYSGQAMTEIPSILLLCSSLTLYIRGLKEESNTLILAGAALLGATVNIREGAILYAPLLILLPYIYGLNLLKNALKLTLACLLFSAVAFGPFATFVIFDINGYRAEWLGWVEATRMESARHPVAMKNFLSLFFYFFLTSPLILLLFPFAYIRGKRSFTTPVLLFGLVGMIANVSLIIHYSVVLNARYLLTGLPALAPLTASYLSSVIGFRRSVMVISAVALISGSQIYRHSSETVAMHAVTGEYLERLRLIPKDAVIMAGSQTVSVNFWKGVGTGNWRTIGTGAGWPAENLHNVIEGYLKKGDRVFIDLDPRFWPKRGWHAEETRALPGLTKDFRFRHTHETLYEIRPKDDRAANDTPPFTSLT
jgi:hypothetical protein